MTPPSTLDLARAAFDAYREALGAFERVELPTWHSAAGRGEASRLRQFDDLAPLQRNAWIEAVEAVLRLQYAANLADRTAREARRLGAGGAR